MPALVVHSVVFSIILHTGHLSEVYFHFCTNLFNLLIFYNHVHNFTRFGPFLHDFDFPKEGLNELNLFFLYNKMSGSESVISASWKWRNLYKLVGGLFLFTIILSANVEFPLPLADSTSDTAVPRSQSGLNHNGSSSIWKLFIDDIILLKCLFIPQCQHLLIRSSLT